MLHRCLTAVYLIAIVVLGVGGCASIPSPTATGTAVAPAPAPLSVGTVAPATVARVVGTPTAVRTVATPRRAASVTSAAAPHGIAFANDWALMSISTPVETSGVWMASARIRNGSDQHTASLTVSYLDASGTPTHVFQGTVTDVPTGRTVTVQLLAAPGARGVPSGRPELDVTAF